jgi:(5-formylfuran-3-yl)methyl phosphate synthase
MTRLLVSVRSAEEAADAVSAGADLIDVKEPSAGSLGAATPRVVAAVMKAVAGRRPTSIALGELNEGIAEWSKFAERLPADRLPQFVKFGLAGCSTRPGMPRRWKAALATLPAAVAPVAVLYADWSAAGSPAMDLVLRYAQRLHCRALLVDTFDKRGPGLLRLWSAAALERCVTMARNAGLLVVLGGQVTAEQFDRLLPLAPDFIAVRGAVCRGNRSGRLDPDRVAQLSERLKNTRLNPRP